VIRRSALGMWRKQQAAARKAQRSKKAGGSVWDLLQMEQEQARADRRSAPVVIVVDADPAALEASARAIANLMGDDLGSD
jgi:hypothetical protein